MTDRGRRRRRKFGPGRLAKLVLALAVGLLVGWWVVKTDVVYAEEDNPFAAAVVAPDDPRVRLGIATVYFELRGGRVPPAEERAAVATLQREPLADTPFLLAGVAALAANDIRRGELLLTEARRRNPRLQMARLLLLDRYVREGRVAEATAEMAALSRLIQGSGTILTQQLASMVRDPATAAKTLPVLSRNPDLKAAVIIDLAKSDVDPQLVLSMAGPALVHSGRQPLEWQMALLARMLSGGDLARSLRLWQKFAGLPESNEKGLYDSDFRGLAGPPPFNWSLATAGLGAAEPTKGGLRVDYYGRDDGDLASQLLMLRPGRYRFGFRASGDASGDGSRLIWTISCYPKGSQLLQLPLTGVASATRGFSGAFTVPASGCAAQSLRLQGASGDVPTEQNATITGLSLHPEAGS